MLVVKCWKPAKIIRVVDGDTIDVTIDLGLGLSLTDRVRVLNFDAAETWRPRSQSEHQHGIEATQFAAELLKHPVWVSYEKRGSFGRILVDIKLSDGRDFATVMKENGMEKRPTYD